MAVDTITRIRDLRTALAAVEERGELVRIQREVDPAYELPNVARTSAVQPKRPVLLFERIKGFPGWRVATSMLADWERTCFLFGLPTDPVELKEYVIEKLENPIPPVVVDRAPCQENVVLGDDIDLEHLIPWTHGALHVTHRYLQGPVVTKDPRTGKQNLAVYRTCIQTPRTVTVNGRWYRHLG